MGALKQFCDQNGKPLYDSNGKPLRYESTAEEPEPAPAVGATEDEASED